MPTATKPSLFRRLRERFVPSRRELIDKLSKAVHWSDRRIPRGVRTLLGVPLMIGGVFSFLPVLGLWMLPAGAALIALDFPGPRRKLLRWLDRKQAEYADKEAAAGREKDGPDRPPTDPHP